jgi:methionyl-tRNA formyltransferase
VQVQNKTITVQTGQGTIRLLEVQLPNAKRITASAFLNAHTIDGEILS